jgi:hypothetical protein
MSSEYGYGRPPKHRQFKKGKSGNPRGRSKGSKNFKTLVADLLAQKIPVTERGRRRSLPAVEVLLRQTLASALKGDAKSTQQIFQLMANHSDDGATQATTPTAIEDAAVLRRVLGRLGRELEEK